MLITVDKRGSINLPAALRKELGVGPGTCLELSVQNGGAVLLQPVIVYPGIRLSEQGLAKLQAAREGGRREMPDWLVKEMADAETDPVGEIS